MIYIRVGVEIFQKRSQLRAIGGNGSETLTSMSADPKSEPFTGIRTTEVEVTHDPCKGATIDSPASPAQVYGGQEKLLKNQEYSISISAHDHRLPPTPRAGLFPKMPSSMDKVKWAYTKCAMLFAISILITWIPASVNRVYGLRYPTKPSFVLNIGSALVLPLQGFWNSVIYFTTSFSICKNCWADIRSRKDGHGFRMLEIVHMRGRWAKESDSMVELSTSRSQRSMGDSF